MFGFIKKMFGGQGASQASDDPFRRTPPPPAAVAIAPPPVQVPAAVLQRDEIIDARTRIAGYRLSARLPDGGSEADGRATHALLSAANVAALAERRIALVPIAAADWRTYDYRPLIGPNTVFLLPLPDADQALAGWRETAEAIHAAGARVALPGAAIGDARQLISGVADFLVVDFAAYTLAGFEKAIAALRGVDPKLQVIAENVGRWPEHRYCLAHGVNYCIGSFTTGQDEEQPAGEIAQSRLVLIEMINQLRKDADLAEIAEVAKRDPGVLVKVVAMANSPLLGRSQAVTGIDQAIMVLGREQLYRWLSIGMFTAGAGTPRDLLLLEMALARGRFLEVLGQGRHDKRECDELFLLGLLSLLDCLFGVPMASVLERIHLSPAMKEVLLGSSGPLGRYLLLAIAVEKGHAANVARLAGQLEHALEDVEAAALESIAWAEEAVRLSA
jgi:EAL and modified HD-GYP domain-containing signal transduction protein